MITLKNNKIQNLIFIIFLLLIFIIEIIYLLPSPTGDDKYFITLTSNICNLNKFISETTPRAEKGNSNWDIHGFFGYYLMAKFNISCHIAGYFIFNFIIKSLTVLLLILLFKKVDEIDYRIRFPSLFLIISLQTYSQFRPETFAIFLIVFLYISFFYKKYYLLGVLFSLLFYSHPTGFYLTGLFFLLLEYKKFSEYFTKSLIGFFLGIILFSFTYQYNFLDYFFAPLNNSGTYTIKSLNLESISYNYILNKKAVLLIFNFIILYYLVLKKNFLLIIGIPFIIYFGPYSGLHEYNLFFLITILTLQIIFKYNNYNLFKYLFISFFSLTILLPYFTRNIFTILVHGNNLSLSQKFLSDNYNNIKIFPEFIKFTNPSIKLKNKTKPTNKIDKLFTYETYSVNGSRKNCKTLTGKKPEIKIFDKKIFNSNSSYDIYLCNTLIEDGQG